MTRLILDGEKQAELAALNASGSPERQLVPDPLTEARAALNPDLLTDCAENQTWNHYAEFLSTLREADLTEEDFLPAS